MQESRPGGDAPLPFMGRTTDKGRFRFRFRFHAGFGASMAPRRVRLAEISVRSVRLALSREA